MTAEGYGLPMVAVYLLGHKVGDIEEPVLYVRHEPYDYNDNVVTKGLPNPFVSSLTHESIIVQIPRLHGKINNRLDQVLSVFDQSLANSENQHTLYLDDSLYPEDDAEMQRILRRLLMAAASSEMRQDMNVEDEYYSYLEQKETEVLMRDKVIAEKDAQLSQKDAQLSQKDAQLKKTFRMLVHAGLSPEAIAESLSEDIDLVKKMMDA